MRKKKLKNGEYGTGELSNFRYDEYSSTKGQYPQVYDVWCDNIRYIITFKDTNYPVIEDNITYLYPVFNKKIAYLLKFDDEKETYYLNREDNKVYGPYKRFSLSNVYNGSFIYVIDNDGIISILDAKTLEVLPNCYDVNIYQFFKYDYDYRGEIAKIGKNDNRCFFINKEGKIFWNTTFPVEFSFKDALNSMEEISDNFIDNAKNIINMKENINKNDIRRLIIEEISNDDDINASCMASMAFKNIVRNVDEDKLNELDEFINNSDFLDKVTNIVVKKYCEEGTDYIDALNKFLKNEGKKYVSILFKKLNIDLEVTDDFLSTWYEKRTWSGEEMDSELDENIIRKMINEELNRGDVRSIIDDELEDFMKNKKFKKTVNNIVADVLEDFLDSLWRKKSFWKGTIKRN